ncbi:unnamed protein product [Ilex paraguariensis]|uniref:Uncharacterized protein n=1 Tax=Ilex paraguariensis TaxID=185542 RepID=A0ABC8RDY3_9AQUA
MAPWLLPQVSACLKKYIYYNERLPKSATYCRIMLPRYAPGDSLKQTDNGFTGLFLFSPHKPSREIEKKRDERENVESSILGGSMGDSMDNPMSFSKARHGGTGAHGDVVVVSKTRTFERDRAQGCQPKYQKP